MALKVYIVCEESRSKGSLETNNIVAAYATRELAEKRIKECKEKILKKWSKIIDFNDGWEEVDEAGIYTISETTYYEYYYTVWIDEQDVVGEFPVPAPTTTDISETTESTTNTTETTIKSNLTTDTASIPQLRVIEDSNEAYLLMDVLELDGLTWVVYAAVCIENGIDYNSVALIKSLEEYTGASYTKEFALLDNSDFSYLYNEIERELPENPSTMDIYKTVLKKQAENKMLYTEDIFARIFCYERKVPFDKDEFMELHSKTKE